MAHRLSIIVPALNEAGSIESTLRLLQPMRSEGVEVLVVDGGSSDATRTVALPWADRVLLSPRGRARQMNAGAQAAHGEVLLFLHADTQLPANALTRLRRALKASGREWGRFDVTIEGRSRWLPVVAALMNLRSRLTGIATGDQALFVRRKVFSDIGGFPEQPLMEDVELSRRLRRRGRPVCLRDRVKTSGRRWDSRGAWRTIMLMWQLRWAYWRGVPADVLAERYR